MVTLDLVEDGEDKISRCQNASSCINNRECMEVSKCQCIERDYMKTSNE